MTKADQIRASGMSVSVDDATAKWTEFRDITEDRHIEVISRQASEIMRKDRRVRELEGKLRTHRLVIGGVTAIALLALAEDIGWLH